MSDLTLGNKKWIVDGEEGGFWGEWLMVTEGVLGGMSTGCYAMFWQIELQ